MRLRGRSLLMHGRKTFGIIRSRDIAVLHDVRSIRIELCEDGRRRKSSCRVLWALYEREARRKESVVKRSCARVFLGWLSLVLIWQMGCVVYAATATVDPLSLPLAQSSNFSLTYLGSFKVPQGSGNGLFAYGGEAMSVNGDTMYLAGLYYYNNGANNTRAIGEIQIPVLSGAPAYDGSNGMATIIADPVVPVNSSGAPDLNCGQAASKTHCVFLGSLVYKGMLYISVAPFYDTTNGANGFILGANTNLTGWGAVNSASTACLTATKITCTQRYFAGALGVVPSIWQQYLGGPCYEVNAPSVSIESNEINGFGFSTFDCSSYSAGGGSIGVSEALDYYYAGVTPREPSPYMLQYRSFSGPFPLSGGGGCPVTLTAAPTDGTTNVVLATGFSGCDSAATDGPYQITFSDGERRIVHLTDGNDNVPDNLYACNYGVTGCSSFPALASCPTEGCSTSATINPMGDNYFSEYDGPIGYGFIVPGSRSLIMISGHNYGPSGVRGTGGCDKNASGSNDTPIPPDTGNYRRIQITAYDLAQLYQAHEGKIPVYSVTPYAFWSFPNWRAASNAVNNCAEMPGGGSFFFDPTTNILYGTFSSNTYGYGNMIVEEWRVNPLGTMPNAPTAVQVH